MNDGTREQLTEERLQDAAAWWARLRGRDASADAASQWLEWSSADGRNADAFERVAELGAQLNGLDEAAKNALVAEFVPARGQVRRSWMHLAVAAVLVLAVCAGGWFAMSRHISEEHYASQVAENRELRLEDGSQVALGGASSISTRFSRAERDVELESGEAFFEVAHNAQRPFVVSAGKLSVRAIGTAFDVRRDGDRVTITIAEGRVRIASGRNIANTEAVEAVAGQQVSWHDGAYGLVVRNVDPATADAWRNRQLQFIDEPLASVVASINRYRQRPLRVSDPALGAMSFTGTVQIDHLDSWLGALPQIFPLKVENGGDAVVLKASDPGTARE